MAKLLKFWNEEKNNEFSKALQFKSSETDTFKE